jgi:hypothetical protein
MTVKNYTKSVLIRAREGEARSWALRASESGKNLSMCIREVLNAWSGYEPDGLSSESVPPEPEGAPEPAIEHEGVQVDSTPELLECDGDSKPTVTDDDMGAFLSEAFKT